MKTVTSKYLWLLIVFIFAAGGTGVSLLRSGEAENKSLSPERIAELREEYPVVLGTLTEAVSKELSFPKILDVSQTAAVVEVLEKLPEYTLNLIGDANTPEGKLDEKHRSMGFSFAEAQFTQFRVKVTELIAGDPVEEYINLYYNSDFQDIEPDLAPGTKLVTILFKAPSHPEGNYSFTKFGTYYVVDDNYVLSAYESDEHGEMSFPGKPMNGRSVDALIHEIKAYMKYGPSESK
ncbi:hypothetical protein [Paenibacillus tengchongensis]|uniref:hypothetical protein n=1 Tax=Paenibacillus tengchongensis TaxID=2608684 RepID=UPI00124D9F40|nr:hypothetical protein [Paenibacillus tengchongensis]